MGLLKYNRAQLNHFVDTVGCDKILINNRRSWSESRKVNYRWISWIDQSTESNRIKLCAIDVCSISWLTSFSVLTSPNGIKNTPSRRHFHILLIILCFLSFRGLHARCSVSFRLFRQNYRIRKRKHFLFTSSTVRLFAHTYWRVTLLTASTLDIIIQFGVAFYWKCGRAMWLCDIQMMNQILNVPSV